MIMFRVEAVVFEPSNRREEPLIIGIVPNLAGLGLMELLRGDRR